MRICGRVAYLTEEEMLEYAKLLDDISVVKKLTVQIESLTDNTIRMYPAFLRGAGIFYKNGYAHGSATFVLSIKRAWEEEHVEIEAILLTARILPHDGSVSLYNHKLYME